MNKIIFALMLFTCGISSCNGQTSDFSNMTPGEVVDKFFNNYVRFGDIDNAMQLLHPNVNLHKSQDKTARQYIKEVGTPRLLNMDMEVFNVVISDDGNSALVYCNMLFFKTGERKYYGCPLFLKKTVSGWKIMEVDF